MIQDHPAFSVQDIRDGHLYFAGKSVAILARDYGTPTYFYDAGQIDKRLQNLRSIFPENLHLNYAVKANPMGQLLKFMRMRVDGFDVASKTELELALETGMPAKEICLTGPAKSDDDLISALGAGALINLDSEEDCRRALALARSHNVQLHCSLRINPDFILRGAGVKMGGQASPFGTDVERIPAMVEKLLASGVAFYGFHCFTGSQCLNEQAIIDNFDQTLGLFADLAAHCKVKLRRLTIGSGIGIPYFKNDRALDMDVVAKGFADRLARLEPLLQGAQICLESGRYLVGEAGIYVCQVVDRKNSRDKTFLTTDGGMHHHLAASGNFGQVLRRNYPVMLAATNLSKHHEQVTVTGCLCTPLDILADQITLQKAQLGDYIVIMQSGAYGRSASPAGFLSHPPAQEVLLDDEDDDKGL